MDSIGIVKTILFICFFLLALCGIEYRFRGSVLPSVCWFVLFGAFYGILRTFPAFSFLPPLHLTPDVILYVFLPVLIFDSSRKLNLEAAKREAVPSFVLATLGIIVSMYAMALPIRWVSGLPWMHILFFTGIMSATDPVAVTAIFKQFPVPERLRMLIEGESLLNDGTTVILYSLLSGIVLKGRTFLFEKGVLVFALSIGAAILFGGACGALGAFLARRWKALEDHFIGPLLPLIIVYIAFSIAQGLLDISGVIAVMSATIVFRIVFRVLEPADAKAENPNIVFYRGFWNFLGDFANAVLFFMLGVEIGAYYREIPWGAMPWIILALLFSRSVVVYGFAAVFRLFGLRLPASWQHILNLGGLKGALSVALILMIPKDYPYRSFFLSAALVLALFTLLVNTLLTRRYLASVDFSSDEEGSSAASASAA